jgi:hypothetical protein
MIVFVLTYAVLALLGLSLVGSVSPEIRQQNARATQFQSAPSASRAARVVPGGRHAKRFSLLHSDRFFPVR